MNKANENYWGGDGVKPKTFDKFYTSYRALLHTTIFALLAKLTLLPVISIIIFDFVAFFSFFKFFLQNFQAFFSKFFLLSLNFNKSRFFKILGGRPPKPPMALPLTMTGMVSRCLPQ